MSRERTGIGTLTHLGLIVTGAVLTFALSPIAPTEWRDTPSLRWLHLVLAYGLMSALFGVYTLLHLYGTRMSIRVGCYLGLCLYGLGLVALLVTIRVDRPTNPLAIAAVADAVILHYAAGRNAAIGGRR